VLSNNRSPDAFYSAFAYSVTIDEMPVAGFSEVSGLAMELEVETFREGGFNDAERQIAGATKFGSRLVLKRGFGDIPYFWNWYLDAMKGMIRRRNVKIELNCINGLHKDSEAPKWIFREAVPVKWSGPELRAATSAIAFESIELVHNGVLHETR
jgi:phage tail-like protein